MVRHSSLVDRSVLMHTQACGLLYLLGSRFLRGQRVDGELIVGTDPAARNRGMGCYYATSFASANSSLTRKPPVSSS